MEIFKAKGKGVIYNRYFPAVAPARKDSYFIRQGGLNLSAFSQEDARKLREKNPELFSTLFTVENKYPKKYDFREPTE